MLQILLYYAMTPLLLLSTLFYAEPGETPEVSAQDGDRSYAFSWSEGPNINIVEYWNAQERADCLYSPNSWPREKLAAQRAYVLGARQVLRDEWDIGGWIAANRRSTSAAHIHGAETNCYKGHEDFPPHVHVFYVARDADGQWSHINTHQYPDSQGKINNTFVIPAMCGQRPSYTAEADEWVEMWDETCTPAWQQRHTSSGDLELRQTGSNDTYALRVTGIDGDRAGLDVLLSGQVLYHIDIVEYDPINFKMVAKIQDYRTNRLITETWRGDPARGTNLSDHTAQVSALQPGITPVPDTNVTFTDWTYLPMVVSQD